ncbi:MAG: hypothetical protein OXC81_03470, partial [Betaproteobacteria bacterium]|nr:hypothetical protein [Betaproteobacteria bacterium]
LSELSDARTSSFMNKIRSLASAIKRIFVSTHPSTGPAQLPPAASKGSRLSYAQTIDTVKANSASDAKRTAQNVLENFAALDQACRKVPDTSRLLKIVSRDQVSDLLLSGSSFNNIVSQARDLQETSGRDKILIAMSHKSGVGFEQKVALQEHVKQELDIIDKVLKQKYQPSNPKLANVCFNQTNPTFADFRTTMENPYQILSNKGSFSTADDKEVRAWLSKGLEVIDTASKAIAATMINHDGSISAGAALREFESASSKTP